MIVGRYSTTEPQNRLIQLLEIQDNMSSPKSESSVYRHRRVEVLSRDNSDTWFKDMKNWLQGESLWPIVMTQLSQKTPSSTLRFEGSSATNLESLLEEITLLSEYATYKAGMDARGEIDPEKGLEILREAERDLHPEFGLFAKKPYGKPRPRAQEERPRSPIQRDGQNCFLCNESDHQMRSCPYMSAAKRTANQERRS